MKRLNNIEVRKHHEFKDSILESVWLMILLSLLSALLMGVFLMFIWENLSFAFEQHLNTTGQIGALLLISATVCVVLGALMYAIKNQ